VTGPVAKVAVLGCGAVSSQYLPVLTKLVSLQVVAVADVVPELADRCALQFGVPVALPPEAVLEREDIDIVVNLTPIPVHVEVTKVALAQGKHVWSEKPLAPGREEAEMLVAMARDHRRKLGCAPDTLLGPSFQAARKALDDGAIGSPMSAAASMFRAALGASCPYGLGTNPFFDMAPYYLSALVNLFGPAVRVTGCTRQRGRHEPSRPRGAIPMMAGTIEFAGGAVAHLTLAWGTVQPQEVPFFTVVGTEGALMLGNPNLFDEPCFLRPHSSGHWEEVPASAERSVGGGQASLLPRNLRGLGVAELAAAAREDREPRCNGDIALHVVDIVESMAKSAERGVHVELTTRCERPDRLAPASRGGLLALPAVRGTKEVATPRAGTGERGGSSGAT
jgi:predicted dehydrogenase